MDQSPGIPGAHVPLQPESDLGQPDKARVAQCLPDMGLVTFLEPPSSDSLSAPHKPCVEGL